MSIIKEMLKFGSSSLVCFGVDYGLYCLFNILTGNLVLSNISARLISATVNYILNYKVVFQSRASMTKSLLGYAALAVFILTCNTLLLAFITGSGLNKYLAKILVEVILFFLSWFVQHKVIFNKK